MAKQDSKDTVKTTGTGLPVVEAKESTLKESFNAPTDDKYTKGFFKCKEDGELYALAIHEADDYFRTHSLKNSIHFRQDTEAEFRLLFDRA